MSDHDSDADDSGVEEGGGWVSCKVTKKELRARKRKEDLEELFDECISWLRGMKDELDDPGAFRNRRIWFEESMKAALETYDKIHDHK